MTKDLENLIKLQEIDLRIYRHEQSKLEFPGMVEQLEAQITAAKNQVEQIDTKVNEVVEEKKATEKEIADAKVGLEKSKERLNIIKTNREYDAVHAEIASHTSTVSNGEARLETFDNDTEQFKEAREEAQKELEEIKAENEPQIADLKSKIANIDSNIAKEVAEREKITPDISKNILRTYEHMLARRKNRKVVSLVSQRTKNCSICYKVLEPQLLNEIRKANRIRFCQSCGSILILDEHSGEEDQ
jgi:hypothetical protein